MDITDRCSMEEDVQHSYNILIYLKVLAVQAVKYVLQNTLRLITLLFTR